MAQPEAVDTAVERLVERRPWRSKHDRGYSTDGTRLFIDGHLIASWLHGAVRMYHNDLKWCPYRVARASERVRTRLTDANVLAGRDERVCYEHADCRSCAELSRACGESRWAPPELPYFERQEHRRLMRVATERHTEEP